MIVPWGKPSRMYLVKLNSLLSWHFWWTDCRVRLKIQFRGGGSGENSPILSRGLRRLATCHPAMFLPEQLLTRWSARSKLTVKWLTHSQSQLYAAVVTSTTCAIAYYCDAKKRGQHGRICSGRSARGRIELGNTRWGTSQMWSRRQPSQRDIVTAIPLAICVTQ